MNKNVRFVCCGLLLATCLTQLGCKRALKAVVSLASAAQKGQRLGERTSDGMIDESPEQTDAHIEQFLAKMSGKLPYGVGGGVEVTHIDRRGPRMLEIMASTNFAYRGQVRMSGNDPEFREAANRELRALGVKGLLRRGVMISYRLRDKHGRQLALLTIDHQTFGGGSGWAGGSPTVRTVSGSVRENPFAVE